MVFEIPFPEFTKAARSLWEQIPAGAKRRILDTAWCGNCLGAVSMKLTGGRVEKNLLVLEGTCRLCGKKIARAVEPEE